MNRREFLVASGGLAGLALTSCNPLPSPAHAGVMNAEEFHATRRFAETAFGRIAYVERGTGPSALFLHGLPLNGYHWRDSLTNLAPYRRCIAPDFMGLGYSEVSDGQDLSPPAQAEMLVALLDSLAIDQADVVANDSGGAIAQLLAVRHPERVRSMLLTNCDVHENCPPEALRPIVESARAGVYADEFERHLTDVEFARSPEGLGGLTFTDPQNLTDESIHCYFAPLVSTPERKRQFNRYIAAFEPNPLLEIEPLLRRCGVPTRMVWGTGDFLFDITWAYWLDRTLPVSRGVRLVEGAKLFFPEEMPHLIAEEAVALWATNPDPALRTPHALSLPTSLIHCFSRA